MIKNKTNLNYSNFGQQSYRILQYTEDEYLNFNNAICLLGMPGIADVGKFAVDQLIGILNAEKICDIIFYDYPAGAIIDNSVLSTPKAEILAYKDKKNARDILLITADAQAMTPRGIYEISDLIAEIISKFKIQEIISLGAFHGQRNSSKDIGLYVTKTEDFEIQNFDPGAGISKISKGVIIGANGLIPTIAKARFKIPGTVFLAEIGQQQSKREGMTDLKASVLLLDNVARIYNLPIEGVFTENKVTELTEDLENKRKKLEQELNAYTGNTQEIGNDEKALYI